MPKEGKYCLGRVIKVGKLTPATLLTAIKNAPVFTSGKFNWTITDVEEDLDSPVKFIFGCLAKFSAEGHLRVVDTKNKSSVDALARNLLVASSPFVYLPDYSGIAFLHVWDHIQEDIFPRRFKSVIEASFQNFFVECRIETIADYQIFVQKIKQLDKFTELKAKVHPPNPLFGSLWKNLNDYVKKRNATEVTVKEISSNGSGINSSLSHHIDEIVKNPNYLPENPPDVADAAILMAADGYGTGKVTGEKKGKTQVVRTSDTQKSFIFSTEPVPKALAEESERHFRSINDDRNLKH